VAGSGKKLAGHGARRKSSSPPAQAKDGGHGPPPHPLQVRSGQRYVARAANRKRPLQIGRIDRKNGRATARRLDGNQERVALALGRLLQTRRDGQGRFFQFVGFESRRYTTFAVVLALRDDGQAEIVLPEWHPGRRVQYPINLLPLLAQKVGEWMTGKADLSQGRPAWLNVAELAHCPPPLPDVCHRPTYVPAAPPAAVERPSVGRGCGDIMLELVQDVREQFLMRGGLLDVFVIERPTGMRAGDRVYLARHGLIDRYLEVRGHELLPNGDFLRCDPTPRWLPRPITVKGRVEQNHWRWRWWERELEQHGSAEQLAAIADAHDPLTHNPDYVLTHYRPPIRQDAAGAPAERCAR